MDQYQFYPTPATLASRAWSLFKSKEWVRVLEPSAGNGDLALACPAWRDDYRRRVPVDCCEIDLKRHPTLRAKGLNVVGTDFLQFKNGHLYDAVVLNPPFRDGVKHVLHAWEITWDCEIVAILNASSLKNAYSNERDHLLSLIEKHGSVEFHTGAFATEEAERRTEVEVALIYLRKKAQVEEIVGDILSEMKADQATGESLSAGYAEAQCLALPNSVLENRVVAFNAAVQAMKEAVLAEARAGYYSGLIGDTMAVRDGAEGGSKRDISTSWVQSEMASRYLELKDRAWASVLRSVDVMDRLSFGAQRRLEASFAEIKQMEFSVPNVQGFILGIIDSQDEIAIGMCCDVFDHIIRWHTEENGTLYRGWASNDRHRTAGMRIKTTRFILPGFQLEGWQRQLGWNQMKMLQDFDKVFAMLDGGKLKPEVGLCDIFTTELEQMRRGARVSSSYFDCRWYPGIGTIHFFSRSAALTDALNRKVGRHRQWLPPEGTRVSEDFWKQYEKSEKFDKEIRQALNTNRKRWERTAIDRLFSSDEKEREAAHEAVADVIDQVLARHGISTDFLLEDSQQMPLLAA